jgi:hypothetical protein
MARRPLNPRIVNVAIDSSALHRDSSARDANVERLLALRNAGRINLILPKGVRDEILDRRAPADKKEAALPMIFSFSVELNSDEQRRHRIIEDELRGNAKPGKHAADADHLFEASKYCAYFLTEDARILKRAGRLNEALPPSLTVATVSRFLEIFDEHEAADKMPRQGASVPEDSGMVEWTTVKSREKGLAVAAIGHALTEIERSGCSTDWWEREHLAEAINALFRGLYRVGASYARLALEPENQRSPEARPKRGQVSLSDLRRAFALAEAEPLRQFGHFGPIEFVGAAEKP